MDNESSPVGYVTGYAGGEDDEICEDAGRWRMRRHREMATILRNVYPLQLLGPEHLQIRVGTQSLREWIGAAKHRGRVSEFGRGLWLWSVGEEAEGGQDLRWGASAVLRVKRELAEHYRFYWLDELERRAGGPWKIGRTRIWPPDG